MTNKTLEKKLKEEVSAFESKRRAELEKELASPSLEQEFEKCLADFRATEKELIKEIEVATQKLRANSEKFGIPTSININGIANSTFHPTGASKWQELDQKFLSKLGVYNLHDYDHWDRGYWVSSMVC